MSGLCFDSARPRRNGGRNLAEAILSVDPGRDKCGAALVSPDGRVIWRRVVEAGGIMALVEETVRSGQASVVVIGDRTGSREFRTEWRRRGLDGQARLELINEHLSSLEGRARYIAENPPRGWRRFVPRSMRTPERPYDDYVAVVLAERFFAEKSRK